MSEDKKIWELKETAKCASSAQEKESAIRELTSYDREALVSLTEIQTVTTYENIRSACTEAIKKIVEAEQSERTKKS